MTSREHLPWRRTIAVLAGLLIGLAGEHVAADRITYNGETWNDVLIYKSSTMYYVKVPYDGTIFNVPIDAVPPMNVEIVLDPYYRDELRQRYEQNSTQSARTSSDGVGTSVFNSADVAAAPDESTAAPPPTPVAVDGAAPAGVPNMAGDPMAMIKQLLSAAKFTFADEGGDVVATAPDGSTKIVFVGGSPAGGVEYTSTVPEAQAATQKMALGMLANMAGQAAPWAPAFLQQEVEPLLTSGGSAEKSEGPLSIKADVTKAGGNVTVKIVASPTAGT